MVVVLSRDASNSFPRLFTGCSVMERMTVPDKEEQNLATTFPLFSTMDLDLVGLKHILVQVFQGLARSTFLLGMML